MEKEYTKGDLTVVWKPEKCIHAGECVKRLPNVYRPKEKPWIRLEEVDSDALIRQINACPSGALSYYINTSRMETPDKESEAPHVTIMKDGPMVVRGEIRLTGVGGKEEIVKKSTAFCRCGASSNKPYCDGTHKQVDFRG